MNPDAKVTSPVVAKVVADFMVVVLLKLISPEVVESLIVPTTEVPLKFVVPFLVMVRVVTFRGTDETNVASPSASLSIVIAGYVAVPGVKVCSVVPVPHKVIVPVLFQVPVSVKVP